MAAGNEGARGTADPTGQRRNDARRPRAQANAMQQLLSGIAHLQSHRGGRPTLLGAALARALASEPPDAASDDASCEHGDDRSSSDCQPDEATRAAAQAHLAAFRAEHAAAAMRDTCYCCGIMRIFRHNGNPPRSSVTT